MKPNPNELTIDNWVAGLVEPPSFLPAPVQAGSR